MNQYSVQIKVNGSIPSSVMRDQVASVNDGVTESFVLIVHANFRADTPSQTLWRSGLHLLKVPQVVLDRVISMSRCNTFASFLTHLMFGPVDAYA
jgi:hypothetical protein